MLRPREIIVVLQCRQKHHAAEPSLGDHAAVMLDHIAEILLQRRIDDNHRFAEKQAIFRAADVETIRQRGQIFERHVALRAGQRAAQPRAVHKEDQSQPVADLAKRFQLVQMIHRADFRRLADVEQPRRNHVLIRVQRTDGFHTFRRHLAVLRRAGQHLMPRRFHRAGLMHVDMSRRRADSRLIRAQERRNRDAVGRRAARHDMHRRARLAALFADHIRRAQAVFIQSVAAGMLHIGFHQSPHHQRMRALAIVIHEKRLHGYPSRFIVPIIIVSSIVICFMPLRLRLSTSTLASIGVIFARRTANSPSTGIV